MAAAPAAGLAASGVTDNPPDSDYKSSGLAQVVVR